MAEESGQYGVPYPAEEYDSSKYRYLRITDISDDGCLLDNDLKSVSGDNIDSYILSENDIVFARTGNSTGRSYLYDKRHGLLVYAGFLIRYKIDQSKINPKYLHYFTNSSYYKQWVKNLSNGSTRGNINAQTFADCDIIYPSRQQQDILVNTLSAIDEKISLNTRMNAELEAMAKQLYDYWFVQFDFPDENGNPYKSSGGEMVYNSTLKREIPAGWEVKGLGEMLSFSNGINYEKGIEGDKVYRIINVRNITSSSVYINKADLDTISLPSTLAENYLIENDDIIIARSGTPGSTRLIDKPKDILYCGFIIKGKPNNSIYKYYVMFFLKQLEGTQATKTGGSILQNVSQETLKSLNIVTPSECFIYSFNEKIDSYFSLLNKKQGEMNYLTHLRDSLLPMLMNGQVTVE